MNFQGLSAKYRRLYQEHAAWRLMRADNAPHILAFISDLFSEHSEVPYGQAKLLLDAQIEHSRNLGIWDTQTNASAYLNQWIAQGWLRELDDLLTKTDATEMALRFCRGFEERTINVSASHLRIVQEAVRDFVVASDEDIDSRIQLLEDKKAAIQRQIDDLNAGVVHKLTDNEQREYIREIYQLASQLTGDFRLLEEQIRQLDKDIRIEMIEDDNSRGNLLGQVMDRENLLAQTEAGSAFEGFFQLLCDYNRVTEFREQLHFVLQTPAAKYLSAPQRQFLSDLISELSRESDRVLRIRRRTEQELRAYIESGAMAEGRAVSKLISKLEQLAVSLRDGDCKLSTDIALCLPIGKVEISSPDTMRLKQPDERVELGSIEAHVNSRKPSQTMLDSLSTVKVKEVAQTIRTQLRQNSPQTIAQLTQTHPIKEGLEELVAYIRIARAVQATELNSEEQVIIHDPQGISLQAHIPSLLFSESLFPDDIEELAL
ncbi:DUF3375 domain-containing protein [Psychrobacter lutiphocae]|uniref:DUF3375 domain-containing protein n=1 Tax=Psychrobacter lutiphocae TaxID=540500 RepID=UPI0003633563|nr:DUF3375 domain-containing protein [Psychrobacter lutiphocae]